MKLFSQIIRPLISHEMKIRSRKWPEDYYIYKNEEKLIDSMGNVFYYSWEEFILLQQHTLDNAGPIWEVYEEIMDQNL